MKHALHTKFTDKLYKATRPDPVLATTGDLTGGDGDLPRLGSGVPRTGDGILPVRGLEGLPWPPPHTQL